MVSHTVSECGPPMISPDLRKVDFTLDEAEDPRFPHWPCPACGHGVLQLTSRSIHFALSAGMSFAIDLDPFAYFEAYGRFCATMMCVNDALLIPGEVARESGMMSSANPIDVAWRSGMMSPG